MHKFNIYNLVIFHWGNTPVTMRYSTPRNHINACVLVLPLFPIKQTALLISMEISSFVFFFHLQTKYGNLKIQFMFAFLFLTFHNISAEKIFCSDFSVMPIYLGYLSLLWIIQVLKFILICIFQLYPFYFQWSFVLFQLGNIMNYTAMITLLYFSRCLWTYHVGYI